MLIPERQRARSRPFFVIGLLILFAIVGIWVAKHVLQPRQVSGEVRLSEATFTLKDGHATWQPDTGWLTLYLSPHRLQRNPKTGQKEDDGANGSTTAHLIHRSGGSAELTLVLNSGNNHLPRIQTVAFAVSSPSAPDASRIFMQGRSSAPWIQAIAMSNGPAGGFVSLSSTGTCSDEKGPLSWSILVKQLPLEVEK